MSQNYNRGYVNAYPENPRAGIWKPQDVFFKQKQKDWGRKIITFDEINYQDIFYYFGTNKNTQGWVNPTFTSYLNITASSFIDVRDGSKAVDRNNGILSKPPISTTNTHWHSSTASILQWWQVHFLDYKLRITDIVIQNRNTGGNFGIFNGFLQGSFDGLNWGVILNLPTQSQNETTVLNNLQLAPYPYFRILNGRTGAFVIGEIYFWGEIIDL